MPLYAFGSNLHGQISQEPRTAFYAPARIDAADSVVAASWSQAVVRRGRERVVVHGLPLETPSFDLRTVTTWLGHDEFVAVLDEAGHVVRISDGRRAPGSYARASMNSRGELLLVPACATTSLVFCRDLDTLLNQASTDPPTTLSLPFFPSSPSNPEAITSISSGGGHFLVLSSPSNRLFAFGDNRFGQLGVPTRPSLAPSLTRVDALDGSRVVDVSTGSFHSAVVASEGDGLARNRVELFGSDANYQCGGTGGGTEPVNVPELSGGAGQDGDESAEEEEDVSDVGRDRDEVEQVCCFGESTIVRTSNGSLWIVGDNEHGQLGLPSDVIAQPRFVRHPSFGPSPLSDATIPIGGQGTPRAAKADETGAPRHCGKARKLVCSRWTVYVEVDET